MQSITNAFQEGEVFKEAFLEALDLQFDNRKNKPDLLSSIKDRQLLRNTVMRRCECMAEEMSKQLDECVHECEYFSLQFDKSIDVVMNFHKNGVQRNDNKRRTAKTHTIKRKN